MTRFEFEDLSSANLVVDATYAGGNRGNAGDDPISKLLQGVGNMGGFRSCGSLSTALNYVVLYTSGMDRDWPDFLDPQTGVFQYFGDNKIPGQELHETKKGGNRILKEVFESLHIGERKSPPFFIFQKEGSGRNAIFRGLAAPGTANLTSNDDLVAVWRTTSGKRFQNYRALFSVLDAPVISREWLNELSSGESLGPHCPDVWRRWCEQGEYDALVAPKTTEHRSKEDQQPHPGDTEGNKILGAIRSYFSLKPTDFEECAVAIWQMIEPAALDVSVTRPSKDGGRDAVGKHYLGPHSDKVAVDFVLEAKLYGPDNSVGVRETARLISRLLHRQYGVLVTTSFVHKQTYEEIREDGHPVVIVSGRDIVEALKAKNLSTADQVQSWLNNQFPH